MTLVLVRPDQRNSLTRELISEMTSAISPASDDRDVRVTKRSN